MKFGLARLSQMAALRKTFLWLGVLASGGLRLVRLPI